MPQDSALTPPRVSSFPIDPPPGALLLTALSCGVVRASCWLLGGPPTLAARVEVALVELCHWLAFGAYFSLAITLATALARRSMRSPRWRHSLRGAVLYLACLLPLAEPTHGDLTSFAARQTLLPAPAVLVGGVLLTPLVPLLAAAASSVLARRFGRIAALVLAGLGILGVLANGWVLAHDYLGVHLNVALVSAGLIVPACRPLPRSRPLFGFAALAVVMWALLGTPPQAAVALANDAAAAVTPTLDFLRHRATPRRRKANDQPARRSAWFDSRANLPPRAAQKGPVAAPVVLLISVDAMRADVIHSGKYDERLPNFTALRRRGAAFSAARAPATLTKVSLSSLFRSNYYSQQYWTLRRKDLYVPEKDETTTLPELLSAAGVATTNVRTIAWLKNGQFFRGFRHTRLAKDPNSRYASVRVALPELKSAIDTIDERPAFVFTHLSDPHEPYTGGKKKDAPFERYLREVELVDRHLGKLLAYVQKKGLSERTYVIVTSDHGEEFGEHHAFAHGTTLYDPALRVPLIIAGPGVVARELDVNVTLLDLFPTILDLFGVPTPEAAMGETLLGVALGAPPTFTRPIAAETRLTRAFITPQNLKVIWDTRSGRVEVYDLTTDPAETKNLHGRGSKAARAFEDVEAFFAAHARTKDGYQPPYFR